VNLRACYHSRDVLTLVNPAVGTGMPFKVPGTAINSVKRTMYTICSYKGDLSQQLSLGTTDLPNKRPGWGNVGCEGHKAMYRDGIRFFHRINNSVKWDLQFRASFDVSLAAAQTDNYMNMMNTFPKVFRVLVVVARHTPIVNSTAECNNLMNILLPFNRGERDTLVNSDMEWAEYLKTRPKHILHWQYVTFDFSDYTEFLGEFPSGGPRPRAAYPTKTINVSIPWLKIWPYCVTYQSGVALNVPTLKKAREDYMSLPGNTPAVLSESTAASSQTHCPVGLGIMPIGNNPHEWCKVVDVDEAAGVEQRFNFSVDLSMCSYSRMSIIKDLSQWSGPRWETGTIDAGDSAQFVYGYGDSGAYAPAYPNDE